MNKLRTNIEFCPHCKSNLQGKEIGKEDQEIYGATHFSRKIRIHNLDLNMVTKFACPDCGGKWDILGRKLDKQVSQT